MPEKRSLTIRRENCYHKIYIYEQRKKKYLKEEKNISTILSSIYFWKEEMKRIDKSSNRIIALANFITTFTGFNVKLSSKLRKSAFHNKMKLARSLFYKYGLEHNIASIDLREFVGEKNTANPSNYRKAFTKSFYSDNKRNIATSNKILWDNFKRQFEEIPILVDDFIDNRSTIQQ